MTKDNKKYLQKEFIEIQKGFYTCKKKVKERSENNLLVTILRLTIHLINLNL